MRDRLRRLRSKPSISGLLTILVFIWKIFDNADTARGISEMVATTWEFLDTTLGMITLLAIGVGLIIFAVLRPEPPKGALSDKQLAEQSRSQLSHEGNNFAERLFIQVPNFNWLPLLDTDSYFTIDFYVYSSSIFRLDIGNRYEGHLHYGIEPMERSIEVMKPIKDLARSKNDFIRLRQWVSPSRMNQIALDGGKEISLVFSDINIRVEGKLPGSGTMLISRLPLPNEIKVKLPTRLELENQ